MLCAAGAADGGFALRAVVVGIEVEVDVVGFTGASDKFDVGKSAVELGDGGIEIAEIAAAGGDDIGNLVLIANFGPQVLAVSDAGGVGVEGRPLASGIDGLDFLEDDIALENGFAVLDDVGDGPAAVKSLADLLCGRRWRDGDGRQARSAWGVGTQACYPTRWTCGETKQREEPAN